MAFDNSFSNITNNNNPFGPETSQFSDRPVSDPSDPTLMALSSDDTQNFYSYPQDLTSVDNPGHFVLFQAFHVEGIKLSDIAKGIKETTGEVIDQSLAPGVLLPNAAQSSFELSGLGQTPPPATDEAVLANMDDTNILANRITNQRNVNNGVENAGQKQDVLGKRKELKDTIALYMPNNLQVAYGFDYSMENTLLASGVRAVVDWMNNPNSSAAGRASVRDMKNFITETGIKLGTGSLNLFGQDLSGVVSSVTRKVLNPHLEFLFRQVNQRSFSYTFSFFPRNKYEVEQVHEIIKKFKYHAHPIYDSKSTFLTMPSEFDIVFYSSNKENKYLNRVLPCVLTGIDVNYTPNGQAAFFKEVDADKSQAPVQIEMTLNFSETGLLHRDHIEQNY